MPLNQISLLCYNTCQSSGSKKAHASSSQRLSDPSLTKMVLIKAGNYTMGTDSPVIMLDAEAPSRIVWLDDYYYDKYEASHRATVMRVMVAK